MVETITLSLPSPESAIALSGNQEDNLKTLARQTGATLVLRGQDLLITGTKNQIDLIKRLIESLEDTWSKGQAISSVDILTARHALDTDQVATRCGMESVLRVHDESGEVCDKCIGATAQVCLQQPFQGAIVAVSRHCDKRTKHSEVARLY